MLFDSVELTWQFLAASLLLVGIHRFVRPGSLQTVLLSAVNLGFIASFVPRRDLAVLLPGLLLIHVLASCRTRSRMRAAVAVTLLLLWFVPTKYDPFQTWLNSWISTWQIKGDNSLLRGIGYSYLFFRALHYLVEIFRNTIVHKGFWDLTRYLTFFPTWASGPIERYPAFVENSPTHGGPTRDDLYSGIYRIALGVTKRALLLAPLITWVHHTQSWQQGFPGPVYLLAFGCLYYLYLYLDFSGFTDLAIGGARLSGYRISENFRTPYLASNLADFWRRWHITLSFMVRDYLFKPMVRSGLLQRMPRTGGSIVAYLGAFAVMGLWHGASWYFAAWGLWHGLGLSMRRVWLLYRPASWEKNRFYQGTSYFATQIWVAVGWVFFAWPLVMGAPR